MNTKSIAILLGVFFLIGAAFGFSLKGCKSGAGKTTLVRSDTVVRYIPRTDTLYRTVELTNNIPYTVWGHDTVLIHHIETIHNHDTTYQTFYICHSDTVGYKDTLRQAEEFKAEIFDTLYDNRIISRQIKWANLTPIETRTITNTRMLKTALIKVYIGADAYGGKSGPKYNLDLAPAASLVFNDRYMLDLGYYIFNQQLTAGFKVKLSFKKP